MLECKLMRRMLLHPNLPCQAIGLAVLGLVLIIRFPVIFFLHPPFLMDLNTYRFAAEVLRIGQGHALYDLGYNEVMFFKYAPIWAVVWTPLAYLGPHASTVAWSVLSVGWILAILALATWMIIRLQQPVPLWAAAAAILLITRPLLEEFGNGQANFWWAGFIMWGIASDVLDRPGWAGWAFAASICLKLPSAIALPYFILVKRWKTAGWTLTWLLVWLWIGAWAANPHAPAALLTAWAKRLMIMGPAYVFRISDQSLLALFGRLCTADGYGLNALNLSRPVITAITLATGAGLYALVLLPWGHPTPRRRAIDLSLLTILMILGSPSAWPATYCVLLAPIFVAVCLFNTLPGWARWDPLLLIWTSLTLLLTLLTLGKIWKAIGIPYWHQESYVFLVFMTLPLCGLALFALLHRQRQILSRDRAPATSVSLVADISGS